MNYHFVEGTAPCLLVFFHGTGGDEQSMLFLREKLDPEAAVLSFRGNVGQGKSRRFFAPLVDGQLDLLDFEQRLTDFIDQWPQIAVADYQQIIFVGFSNGANFIAGLLTKRADLADCYLLLHPSALDFSVPLENSRADILVTAGLQDQLVDPVAVQELYQNWQETAFPKLQLAIFDQGHFLTIDEIDRIINWYQTK
ncbi:alpha/beta hydrolase [Streptococcus suis]